MSAKDRLAMFQSKASGETKKSSAPTKKIGKLSTTSSKKTTKTSVKKEATKSESGDKLPKAETGSKENVTVVEEKTVKEEGTSREGGITETKVTKTEKTFSKTEGGVKSTEVTKTEKVTETKGGEQKTVKEEGTDSKGGIKETKVTKTEKTVSKTEGGVKSTEVTKTEKVTETNDGEQKTVKDEVKQEKVTEELSKKPIVDKSSDKVEINQKKTTEKVETPSKTKQEETAKAQEKSQKTGVDSKKDDTKSQDKSKEKDGLKVPASVKKEKTVSSSKSQLTASIVLAGGESDLDLDSEFEANIDFVSDAEAITPMVEAQKPSLQRKQKADTEKQKQKDSKPSKELATKEDSKPAKPAENEITVNEEETKPPATHIIETTKEKSMIIEGEPQVEEKAMAKTVTVTDTTETDIEHVTISEEVSVVASEDKDIKKEESEIKETDSEPTADKEPIVTEEEDEKVESEQQEKTEGQEKHEVELQTIETEEEPTTTLIITSGTTPTVALGLAEEERTTLVESTEEKPAGEGAEVIEVVEPGEGDLVIRAEIETEESADVGKELEATMVIADSDVTISGDLVVSHEEEVEADSETPLETGQLIISANVETSEEVYEIKDESETPAQKSEGKTETEQQIEFEENVTKEEASDEEPVPEEQVSKQPIPEEPVPEEAVPKEAVPEEPVPKEAVPKEPVPEEPVPEETAPEEPVPDVPVIDKNEPFYPKLSRYNPLPDEFYDTIFYFSGMGRLIGSALAQGVYVNSKAAKSALDLGELEKLNDSKPLSKKEDIIKTVRHQAQDLSLDLKHLQTLLDGLPNFQDQDKTSGDIHLVFKQTAPTRSRSQPPIRQPDPEYSPWVKTGSVHAKVQSFTNQQGKVPVMPGMPQYQASQDGWLQAPPKPQVNVAKPAMKTSQLPATSRKAEAEAIKEEEEEKITPTVQMSQKTEEKAVNKNEEKQEKIEEATPSNIPPAPPLPQSNSGPVQLEPSLSVTVSSRAAAPDEADRGKSNLSLQQSVSGFAGGALAPQANQPKTGGARLYGVQPGVTNMDSQPWQGRVGVNVDIPKFTPPKPFSTAGQANASPKKWHISSPDVKVSDAPKFVPAKPKAPEPLTPQTAESSPSVGLSAQPLQKATPVTTRGPSQPREASVDKENYGPDTSMSKVQASGLKPWQLSRIRALEAKGILVQNENKEDHSEATYRLAHMTSLKKPDPAKPRSQSFSTVVSSSSNVGEAMPTFYPPAEQKAVRSVPFNPMKAKTLTAPTPVSVGFSDSWH